MTFRWWALGCLGLLGLTTACTLPREKAVHTLPSPPVVETPAGRQVPGPLAETRPVGHGAVVEEGVASWYGPDFHGKATANGERYEQDRLTAAHRTLPFNTLLWVHRPARDLWVPVRINDRGPFVKGRILDLSREAARRLHLLDDGTDHVVLYAYRPEAGTVPPEPLPAATVAVDGEKVGPPLGRPDVEEREAEPSDAPPDVDAPQRPPPHPVTPPAAEGWGGEAIRLQVGAFTSEANARRLLARIRHSFPEMGWEIRLQEGWHRVLSAPQRPGPGLDARMAALRDAGFPAIQRRDP